MTKLDWLIVVLIGFTGFGGYRRGLIGTVLSLAGLVAGAIVGARVGPHFLAGGAHSQYTALAGLGGAAVGVGIGRIVAAIVAKFVRGGLHLLPPLHLLDSIGGAVVGVAWGLVLVWIVGAVALQIHGHRSIRRDIHRSKILHRLDLIAPPHDVLRVPKQLAAVVTRLDLSAQ